MDREKDLLFLPYTYTPSSSTVGLLLDLQYYQRRESMIFKIWVKSKFVLWQPRYYNWLTEKRKKTNHVFGVLILLKTHYYRQFMELSSNTIFGCHTFGKVYFYNVKFNNFSGRPCKVKEMFWNIFDWSLCWWYWK